MPNIILPKKIVPITTTPERPLFFLAGPIRGGGDWQHAMAWELLQRVKDVQIACPSRWTAEHPLPRVLLRAFLASPQSTAPLGTTLHGAVIRFEKGSWVFDFLATAGEQGITPSRPRTLRHGYEARNRKIHRLHADSWCEPCRRR